MIPILSIRFLTDFVHPTKRIKGLCFDHTGITGRPALLFGNRSVAFGAKGISFEKMEIPGRAREAAFWFSANCVSVRKARRAKPRKPEVSASPHESFKEFLSFLNKK